MNLARRAFFGVLAAAANPRASLSSPAVSRHYQPRVTQSELEDAIPLHSLWLDGDERGRRAVFSNRDLSGLDFGRTRSELVVLRDADFTEADLTGIQGNEVNFHCASLQGARLSYSNLIAPIFSGATLRRAECKSAVWGRPANPVLESSNFSDLPAISATFIQTDLSLACFDNSMIRGYFSGASFSQASLRHADFDRTIFGGVEIFCQNSFSEACLLGTSFKGAQITAARFRFAKLEDVDFSNAQIGPGCTWPPHYTPPLSPQ
ncbi:pentapeptide repeat-containing protein [Bradyrhizobium sp. CCGB01]|uniref:pentapeptide repeat-containing protein n=1 Tax=Bradyrhizobium sp. CCGB01 TaxID=2949634 RepID=UPI0035C69367